MPPKACSPADRSATGIPGLTGGPPGRPVTAMIPLIPCTTASYAGRCAHGPVCPKPLTEQYTSRGLRSSSCSGPRPRRSMTPGRKFSTSTSARAASSAATARSAGSFRSRATDSLPRLTRAKYSERPSRNGP